MFQESLVSSRRDFLHRSGMGFGAVALSALLAREGRAAGGRAPAIDPLNPLRERLPHLAPRAKQVIFLFQYGGPSTFDLLDYKPDLIALNGKPVPESLKKHPDKVGGVFNACADEIMAGPWKWAQHGESGQWVSDLLPYTAQHVDDLCQVRSMFSESSNHAPATYLMNTGAILGGKPSLGSWVTYGLGSANQNLPGFVLLYKVGGPGRLGELEQCVSPGLVSGNAVPLLWIARVESSTARGAGFCPARHARLGSSPESQTRS